ncbi:MAG: isoprenyl transferase [Deltaproteobacteria bacterium]|nr:isoprenyl transferase [Deltaproteobacteria bacterium]MBN2671718.1 isoprenyl transferase [Deltaproteobacteria bacterium]
MDEIESNLPKHVGIIMDGNGRWARSRGMHRVAGHRQGAKTVDMVVTACRKRGIRFLTLYAFSSQNWSRPSLEIKALMELLAEYVRRERQKIMSNNIRLTAIGEIDQLPESVRAALQQLMTDSKDNTGMTLCLALSYGGQEEIVAAAKQLCARCTSGELSINDIDNDCFSNALWSSALGPVDLMIRTSGELRLSNFLLWSCAYAEFYFSDKMWPEFEEADLETAFSAYASRNRRYGTVGK